MPPELPIAPLRAPLLEALAIGPVVISSPTGSGKSTEVPRWCPGRVLVIEPRRVACQSLAARVSQLEGTPLGELVGYAVRDDAAFCASTRIVFATPGIALRNRALLASATTVVLDEFHERGMESDLLLGLLLQARKAAAPAPNLIIMSATLDGERVAAHVAGRLLLGEGRVFPVAVHYVPMKVLLPEATDLPSRVLQAVSAASQDPGDILVFLPGKAEIEACRRLIAGNGPWAVVALHGGLSLDEQGAAFAPSARRKLILATNVAETSITIPGVGVVIDSGLVKQTRYRDGRASLVLGPIAEDSASQRAGRAGRTSAGVCYRLWSSAASLAKSTLPELQRESLVPLVLAAAAWKTQPEDLPLLDAPKPYALADARAELAVWGALAPDGSLSSRGEQLHNLPIDPAYARLLLEAKQTGCLPEAVDLVAALSSDRQLFRSGEEPVDDLRRAGCDITALVRAMRAESLEAHGLSHFGLEQARKIRARLRRELGLSTSFDAASGDSTAFDREALLSAAVAADPRVVHMARRRGSATAFSNGGTELELARESAVRHLREVEALVVLDTRAFGAGKDTRLLVTCAGAVSLAWIAKAGLGQDRLGAVRLEGGEVLAKVERVFVNRVIATRDEVPTGELSRQALSELFLRGSLFKSSNALALTRERVAYASLAAKLAARGYPGISSGIVAGPPPSIEQWVSARLAELGVESGADLALLSPQDLVPHALPTEVQSILEKDFPRTVDVGDSRYETQYDLDAQQVTLRVVKGSRKDPPSLAYLPKFRGLRICLDGPRGFVVLRERR